MPSHTLSRSRIELLDRLRREPGTFPEDALAELRQLQHHGPLRGEDALFFGELHLALWAGTELDPPESLLNLLERNPYFFRSGYVKIRAIRALRRTPLNLEAKGRIAAVVRRAVLRTDEHPVPEWWRLVSLMAPGEAERIAGETLGSESEAVVREGVRLLLVHRGKTHRLDTLLRRGQRSWAPANTSWEKEIAAARAEFLPSPP